MIRIEKLTKSYGRQVVLNKLDLEIPANKITVIIGRSGEGKSVLLKHIIGLNRPNSGKVFVGDTNVFSLDQYQLTDMRKKFGMLFQNGALFDSMTVEENISFPLKEHSGFTYKKIRARVLELISLVGLKRNVLQKFPSELSGGMRKRVGLARALALNPEILLYDEPTTGLDPIMTDVVDNLILDTQKQLGITTVVISHDIKAVFAISDQIAMLHEGKILMTGSTKDFKTTKNEIVQNFLEGKATDKDHAKDAE